MININNELSELLKEIFYTSSKDLKEYIPIIKNSKNIINIIPYFLSHNKNNKEDIDYIFNLVNELKELFKLNNNLIPLFMNKSIYSSGKSFYECLIMLFLKEYFDYKKISTIEELIKIINIDYPLSKNKLDIIYNYLSQYFMNDANNILTPNLFERYLHLLHFMYTNHSDNLIENENMKNKNYIYFNGINSKLSFILNQNSCNHDTDFPTLENGFSFVFWIKLNSKIIEQYFQILNNKRDINLIKINIGGELLMVKLISPKTIIILNKDFSTINIEIDKLFKYDEWNSFIFIGQGKKNQLSTKLFINKNQIDNEIRFIRKIDKKEGINNIDLFENLLGKVSSIMFFSFVIDCNCISYFSSINGFFNSKILERFLISLDDNYYVVKAIEKQKLDKIINYKLKNSLKIKLKDNTRDNIICCFCPFALDESKNMLDDVFGNFIGKLGNNDGIIFNRYKAGNIQSLGGINNLLPIFELMFSSLKNNNPYKLIGNIFTEKTLVDYLILIQKILFINRKNIIEAYESKFFSSLNIFLENVPSKFFTLNILKILISIISITTEKNEIKINNDSSNIINLLLLDDKIIIKFPLELHLKLWETIGDILINNLNLLKNCLNTSKICLLIEFYDQERYRKFCCKKHACLVNTKEIELNKKVIMFPELNIRIKKLFDIIQFLIDNNDDINNNCKDIFKILTLDLSPCLQNKIIFLYISHFMNEKVSPENKNKTLINLLRNNFVEISKYLLKVSLLDTRVLFFRLFNFFVTDYKNILNDYLTENSKNLSEIIHFFISNIYPNNLIIGVDKEYEHFLKKENYDLFLKKAKIKEINKLLYENSLFNNENYIRLIDIIDKKEYNRNIEDIWNFFYSSLKYIPQSSINSKSNDKKKKMINPFILNCLIFFVSKSPIFYLTQFLIEILSTLKDDFIKNRNIFYKKNEFFPWLLDTIYYFHNKKNELLFTDKDLLNTIKSISIKIICDLFSHRREKDEIFNYLRYILEYSYHCKKIGTFEDIQEILRITRFLLLNIFEYSEINAGIKSKIIFEFMILFKNSNIIFQEENMILKEENRIFNREEFIENDIIEGYDSDNLKRVSDINVSKKEKLDIIDCNEDIDVDKNKENEDENSNKIEYINDSEQIEGTIDFPSKELKNSIILEENDIIPDYFFEGINFICEIGENKNKKLENIWNDYKLFFIIREYYKTKLWGLEKLYKDSKNLKYNLEDKEFSIIIKDLYKYYGERKEIQNFLIKQILKFVSFEKDAKKDVNILYINIILLSLAIDISEDEEEKEELYFDYQQFLLFFILVIINMSSNFEIKDKSNNNINSEIQNFLYNIIGYGFIFLKKRELDKYKKFKNDLIKPLFKIDSKIIFGYSKNDFFKNTVIGKLFSLKNNESKDDIDLNINFKKEKEIKKHIRLTTDLNNPQILFESNKGIKPKLSQYLDDCSDIYLRANSKKIIKEVIKDTINIYKFEQTNLPKGLIIQFYGKQNIEDDNKKTNNIINDFKEMNKMEEYEKNIEKTVKQTIKDLINQNKQYFNNFCFEQMLRKKNYKKIKKKLFSWNGFWSNKNLFYKHPEYLKLRIKNHFTKDMTKVLLAPILDIDYYLPNFKKFDKNKLFNKDDYKYYINLNVDEILKLKDIENKNKDLQLGKNNKNKDNNIINFNNNNEIKQKKFTENNDDILKKEIITDNKKNEENSKDNNIQSELGNLNINIILNESMKENMSQEDIKTNNLEIKKSIEEKEILIKKIHVPSKIIINSAKSIHYLKYIFQFSFKGIWELYHWYHTIQKYHDKSILGYKDIFDLLIHKKLTLSKTISRYENIYICCIVKPTHHIKGFLRTEDDFIKFIYYDEDAESEIIFEDDINYDKELHCCFGSIFKNHLKDRDKLNFQIYFKDIKYIFFRNYFYQETAIEIYTFSNKSYFFNFKNNKEMEQFKNDILNHESFIKIIGKDLNGKKLLGYKKSFDSKTKIIKIKEIMNNWRINKLSTLRYLMYLNILSGRSFNDLTQYPIFPWIITNYQSEEIANEDLRDLSVPMGMLEVSDKSINRKELFLDFYETLKRDFIDANNEFNYKEFLRKGGDYLEQYKLKMDKKKNLNKNEEDMDNDNNICKIEINQIPFFYGTHYSCATYVSHFLMRIFPFSFTAIEIHGNKFDDPDRIFISLKRTFESASTLKEDIRELIPEFYTLPEIFLNKNNLNLTQDKLDFEGKEIVVNDVDLPLWCNNLSFNLTTKLRKNLETSELNINKWIDLIFGYLQKGEKSEAHHNIYMAQSYENMVKIDKITDDDERNALMRLIEIGITPKQLFKKETSSRKERVPKKWNYLYESKKLFMFPFIIPKYDELSNKILWKKSINKESNKFLFPKIIKLKSIGLNELLLINELNFVTKIKIKNAFDNIIVEEKEYFQVPNISSEYTSSFIISSINTPLIIYNDNKYMIKGGFWDGRIELNSLIIDLKEKVYSKNNIYIKEGKIIIMEMTNDEKILICGTDTGYLYCFSINGLSLTKLKRIDSHNDKITSININDNLNMFATSSLDGYVNLYTLPSFELVRSLKVLNTNISSYYEKDFYLYYADNVFLSSSPLPCFTIYISSKRMFKTFTINGEFIDEVQETNNSNIIKCPIIFNDLDFQEYIIYGTDDGRIKIRQFPNMELVNNICPGDGSEIISLDISKDKKYCYLWMKSNKIFIIKDLYVDLEKDKKQINKENKKLEKGNGEKQ